jgi:hypothetical protein
VRTRAIPKTNAGMTECHFTGRFRGANITTSFGGHHWAGDFALSAMEISLLELDGYARPHDPIRRGCPFWAAYGR